MDATTFIKALLAPSALAGVALVAMAMGVIPVDPGMECAAKIFIHPLGIPIRPFLLTLGPCQILGVLSLFRVGRGSWNPMPEWFGRIGLILSVTCGTIGHHQCGDSIIPGLVVLWAWGMLYYVEAGKINLTGWKKE